MSDPMECEHDTFVRQMEAQDMCPICLKRERDQWEARADLHYRQAVARTSENERLRAQLQVTEEWADSLMPRFEDRYWDSLEPHKAIVLAHIKSVLGLSVETSEGGK